MRGCKTCKEIVLSSPKPFQFKVYKTPNSTLDNIKQSNHKTNENEVRMRCFVEKLTNQIHFWV